MKVGAIADLHFGKNVDGNARLDRNEETFRQLEKACKLLCTEKVDAIVVLGDLSHSNHPSIGANNYIRDALSLLDSKSIPTLVFPGNHDYTHEGNHVLQPFMTNQYQNVAIRDESCKWYEMCVVPHAPRGTFVDVKSNDEYKQAVSDGLRNVLRAFPSDILLTHAQISGAEVGENYMFESGALELETVSRIRLIVAGDIHKRQLYRIGETVICYPGSLTQTDYGEKGQKKGVAIFDTETFDVELMEVKGYIQYYNLKFDTVNQVDEVEKHVWEKCIVNVEVSDEAQKASIVQKILEKNPLSIRDISVAEHEDVKQVSELASLNYKEQLKEYLNSSDFNSTDCDRLQTLAENVMEEVHDNK